VWCNVPFVALCKDRELIYRIIYFLYKDIWCCQHISSKLPNIGLMGKTKFPSINVLPWALCKDRINLQDNMFSLQRYLVLPTYQVKAAKYWSHEKNKISFNQRIILKFSNDFLQWQYSRFNSNFQVVSSKNEWELSCGLYFKIFATLGCT
jgi:hypothetical protein